jgi:lysozyme
MRTSQSGVRFIAGFEGFVNHPYQDAVGVWTIGYGHTGPGVRDMGKITPQRGLQLLAGDVRVAESGVNALGLTLTQNQFDALVSIVFNCGAGILKATAALGRALRAPGMAGVPAAIRLYTHAGGHVLAGLVTRRNAEAELWQKPVPGPASWLTPQELAQCRELDGLRRAAHPDARQQGRIVALVQTLTERRKRIWHAAQPLPVGDGLGWDQRHRRQRYRSLLARTA